jgi:hypothetical protein
LDLIFLAWFLFQTVFRPSILPSFLLSPLYGGITSFRGPQSNHFWERLSDILVSRDEYGLANKFIDYVHYVTTNNYNTIAVFHTSNTSTLCLLSPFH